MDFHNDKIYLSNVYIDILSYLDGFEFIKFISLNWEILKKFRNYKEIYYNYIEPQYFLRKLYDKQHFPVLFVKFENSVYYLNYLINLNVNHDDLMMNYMESFSYQIGDCADFCECGECDNEFPVWLYRHSMLDKVENIIYNIVYDKLKINKSINKKFFTRTFNKIITWMKNKKYDKQEKKRLIRLKSLYKPSYTNVTPQ